MGARKALLLLSLSPVFWYAHTASAPTDAWNYKIECVGQEGQARCYTHLTAPDLKGFLDWRLTIPGFRARYLETPYRCRSPLPERGPLPSRKGCR